MNEDQRGPQQEKAINGALQHSARIIESIKERLADYNTFLNRIEERPSVSNKIPAQPQPSFTDLTLTGKVRFIEEALGLIENDLSSLNNTLNSLV